MVLFWCVSALYLRGFYARVDDFVEISGSTLDLGPSCAGPRLRVDVCLLVLYMLLDVRHMRKDLMPSSHISFGLGWMAIQLLLS